MKESGLVMPASAASGLTPQELVDLSPPAGGRWSIRAVLVVVGGAPHRFCPDGPANETCREGADVRPTPTSGLEAGGSTVEIPGEWLVLVEGGALADPIRAA